MILLGQFSKCYPKSNLLYKNIILILSVHISVWITLSPQRRSDFKPIDEFEPLDEYMNYGPDNLFLQQSVGPFNARPLCHCTA